MGSALDDLLARLARHELSLEEACIEIQGIASSDLQGTDALASTLESGLRAGALAPEIGEPLLDALQNGASPVPTVTRPTITASGVTLVRGREPGAFEATRSLRGATASSTLVRPAERDGQSVVAAEVATRRAPSDERPLAAPGVTPGPELASGAVIKERFVLEERIGRGGMGIVFRALDRSKEIARNPNPQIGRAHV